MNFAKISISKKVQSNNYIFIVDRSSTKILKIYTNLKCHQICMWYILCHNAYWIDLKGKSFAEKSKLMAQTWRNMSRGEKEKFSRKSHLETADEEEEADPSSAEMKKLALRVARRHQGDVCCPKLNYIWFMNSFNYTNQLYLSTLPVIFINFRLFIDILFTSLWLSLYACACYNIR